MLQRRPFQKFHRDEGLGVVLANLVNRADVGMIERRRSAGFAAEALKRLCVLGKFVRKEFQRDEASELECLRPCRPRPSRRRPVSRQCGNAKWFRRSFQ